MQNLGLTNTLCRSFGTVFGTKSPLSEFAVVCW